MKVWNHIKGGASPASIIMLVVAFLCFAYIAPIALNYIAVAVNSSVNATVKTIAVTVGSILFVLGVVVRFMPTSQKG